MGRKRTGKINSGEAAQVFRQFAWNLAGSLAKRPEKSASQKPEASR